ncbi:hypothetical protein [Vibrio sp. 10N.261.51.F12]|uniref:hypothetical protein n=1 Tax=Vibrio sp. 10N.261.51.F12 TaxID=3229679 RepID=UPI003553933B
MFRLLSLTVVFSVLAGCATHDQFATEHELYQHNIDARNFCKDINEVDSSYRCFEQYVLKAPSVTVKKLLATQKSLIEAKHKQS